MLAVFCCLLMLGEAGCSNDEIFQTKTVGVGDKVEINCPRRGTGSLSWIRLGSEKSPEHLGQTSGTYKMYQRDRFKTTGPKGEFILHITRVEVGDTGLYFCIKYNQSNLTFLKITNLTVKGTILDSTKKSGFTAPSAKPVTTAVPTPRTDPVSPEKKTCPGEHSACCLGAGSHQPHSGLNSTQGVSLNLTGSLKKCNCTFFNTSCCDDGAYFCAVDGCEEIQPEGPANPVLEEKAAENDTQTNNTVLHLLITALAMSLIVIAFLLYSVRNLKKQYCGCNKVGVTLQSEVETARRDQQNQQADEDSLIYSAPTFIKRSSSIAGVKAVRPAEEESIYADVRVPEGN